MVFLQMELLAVMWGDLGIEKDLQLLLEYLDFLKEFFCVKFNK
jgi:hypothetical protein